MKEPDNNNLWSWMQPHDVKRFGEVILHPAEQQRWCRAVIAGQSSIHVPAYCGRGARTRL